MLLTTLSGRPREVSLASYTIDWDHVVSKPQKLVKDFLRPYWVGDAVYEEVLIPGAGRLRIDILRFGAGPAVMVEVSPLQHQKFNPFFHGSLSGWKASLKRDIQKERWAALNEITYVELTQTDLDRGLSVELFAEYGVTL